MAGCWTGPSHKQPVRRFAGQPLWSASSAKTPVGLPPRSLEKSNINKSCKSAPSVAKYCHLSKGSVVLSNISSKHTCGKVLEEGLRKDARGFFLPTKHSSGCCLEEILPHLKGAV